MRERRSMQPSHKKPLLLIVDDHPHILGLLGDILRLEGYPIHTASDGQEALESVEACRPDLIFLDLLMPNMDGFAFMDALKERRLFIPIVIITAHLNQANTERLAGYVAEGLVRGVYQKPFPPMVTLLEEVDRLTAQLPQR